MQIQFNNTSRARSKSTALIPKSRRPTCRAAKAKPLAQHCSCRGQAWEQPNTCHFVCHANSLCTCTQHSLLACASAAANSMGATGLYFTASQRRLASEGFAELARVCVPNNNMSTRHQQHKQWQAMAKKIGHPRDVCDEGKLSA